MDLYGGGLKTIAIFAVLELVTSYFVSTPDVSLPIRLITGVVMIGVAMALSDLILGVGNRLIGVAIIMMVFEFLMNMYREYPTIPPLSILQKALGAGALGALAVFLSNLIPTGPAVVVVAP